ncbi:CPBP family intramembrane glutamic endopeptidase [Methylobrevis pamukkalensis]|uniref:CAAX amino terminal protease self-immunity n=1 Tax=Methylobrevis pamukkalensis TaxID=1439726 RepID=A0A1E3H3J9_9HYPH|nr:CPBP family intramembrane glutamic endopeptidase [Methylobrevis pamukkalensis]ODN70899.1 CAAX amino terminal protease self- immunity [Methylobrevis pamukkalensis]
MADSGPDFPYCGATPDAVNGRGWLILLASLALAFAALTLLPRGPFPWSFLPALLFLSIPLAALRRVTGPHWLALFRRVRLTDIGLMILFAIATLASSLAVALVLLQVSPMAANPLSGTMGALTAGELAMLLLPTLPQLVGEELLGILPFLAVLWLCVSKLRLSRITGIMIGLAVSSLIFGAAHLPTYDWNFAQALLVIGSARVILTLAYIVTRNLWVSAGAHVLNDWAGFLAIFALGHMPVGPG